MFSLIFLKKLKNVFFISYYKLLLKTTIHSKVIVVQVTNNSC